MFLASTIAAIGPRPDVATADVDFAALTTLRIGGAPAGQRGSLTVIWRATGSPRARAWLQAAMTSVSVASSRTALPVR